MSKVYIIVDTCTCWKLFFSSLSPSPKKKKRILQNSCETKYTNNTHKKRDLHQSNCSDSTHCLYCRWKRESLYRSWCSKTLFTESSLNFFGKKRKLLQKAKKKLLFLDIHNCVCMGKDWQNAWALGTMQSAVFKKIRTNCSQNDFNQFLYFHVVLVVSVVVVVVVVVVFFFHLRYDWQLS